MKISPQYPFIEAEVRYAVHHEYAQTAIDFLSRRSRLSFLNSRAALDALPRVIEIMGQELRWNNKRKRQEYERATQQLRSMGISVLPPERSSSWSIWLLDHLGFPSASPLSNDSVNDRAIFSPTELEMANISYAALVEDNETRLLRRNRVLEAVRNIKTFGAIKEKQVTYAIQQVGIVDREGLTLEDFMEVNQDRCSLARACG